jgi:hypothetical protein
VHPGQQPGVFESGERDTDAVADATSRASQRAIPPVQDRRTPAMTSAGLQIRNSIIDNKLLKLSAETIPLQAISSIRLCQEPVRWFPILFGGFWAILFTAVTLTEGTNIVLIALAVISYYFCFNGLKTLFEPQCFLILSLHSGRRIRINVANRQEAFQAEAELRTPC